MDRNSIVPDNFIEYNKIMKVLKKKRRNNIIAAVFPVKLLLKGNTKVKKIIKK